MAEMANANIRINADLLAETKEMAKNVGLSFSNLVSVVLEKIREEGKIELNLKKEPKTMKDYDKIFEKKYYQNDDFCNSLKATIDKYESGNMEDFVTYDSVDDLKKELNLA